MVPSLSSLAPFQFAFVARDLDHFVGEAAGHPLIARIHSFGADGDRAAANYDTAETLGFLVEAVEPPVRMPAPDFTI
jgi:hypothetical protein